MFSERRVRTIPPDASAFVRRDTRTTRYAPTWPRRGWGRWAAFGREKPADSAEPFTDRRSSDRPRHERHPHALGRKSFV